VVRLDWAVLLDHARAIVEGYSTGVTLRQLFYRLVAAGLLPNLRTQYTHLSENTAKARREGSFPGLLARTSRIEEWPSYASPEDALASLRNIYRRAIDRYWDADAYRAVIRREESERDLLTRLRLPGEDGQ
jgi:hypothetical protein